MNQQRFTNLLRGLLIFSGGLVAGLFLGGIGESIKPVPSPAPEAREAHVNNPDIASIGKLQENVSPIPTVPSPIVEREELPGIFDISGRVIAVAQGLRAASSAAYLETYQLASEILRLPWTDVRLSKEGRFSRIDAKVANQSVRVAYRDNEIYMIFKVKDDLGDPICTDFRVQLMFTHFGLKSGDEFETLWTSLFFDADITYDSMTKLRKQESLNNFSGYEVGIQSLDKEARKKNPGLVDFSSSRVSGISFNEGAFGKRPFPTLDMQGSVIDRGLCGEVHRRLKALVLATRAGDWPLLGEETPPLFPE